MGEKIDFGLTLPNKNEEIKAPVQIFSEKDIEEIIKQSTERKATKKLVCLVIGQDNTAKTGVVFEYLEGLEKPSLVIDVDGGCEPSKASYHANSDKIIIVDPVEMITTETDVEIDYHKTIAKVKAIIKYAKIHHEKYSAIVIDGVSTLLKFAEYLMRIDKNLAPDGGVQMRYWIQRNKRFTEILDAAKSIPQIDKIFIGHEDFIVGKDAAAVKVKTNQMIHQRIICRREIEKDEKGKSVGNGNVTFKAIIDKSKYNMLMEGKQYEIGGTKEGKVHWSAKQVWEGLK